MLLAVVLLVEKLDMEMVTKMVLALLVEKLLDAMLLVARLLVVMSLE